MTDTPGHVIASVPEQMLFDDGRVALSAEVRDKTTSRSPTPRSRRTSSGPDGVAANGRDDAGPERAGQFQAEWTADKPGSYVAEVIAQARRADESAATC